MLHIHSFTFNSFKENTYIVYNAHKECIIIDPGCNTLAEKNRLHAFIQQHGLKVRQLINTHCHIDHVLGNQYVKNTYQVKLAIHPQEVATLQAVAEYAPQYGIVDYAATEADRLLVEGDHVQLGETLFKVLHVPGHTPGHIALYSEKDALCFVGDILFQGSVGRTDLPGGNYETLIQSIQQKLFPLGDQVVLYPGHGPTTTIGQEKSHPFQQLPIPDIKALAVHKLAAHRVKN